MLGICHDNDLKYLFILMIYIILNDGFDIRNFLIIFIKFVIKIT